MTAEREAFGFYFSAHPIQAHAHLLALLKVKSFGELGDIRIGEGERVSVTMAGMVEDARWRTSAKVRRFLPATLCVASGQFQATAFDDEPIEALRTAAERAACGLLTVELDRRAGDDTPRVAIKRFQPIESLAKRTRLQMVVTVKDAALMPQVAAELAQSRGGTGTVRMHLPLANGGDASVLAGRDFALDAELAARIERIVGEGAVDLSIQEPPKLALVG
jgi:DNA polymerase-3 subunit alpha